MKLVILYDITDTSLHFYIKPRQLYQLMKLNFNSIVIYLYNLHHNIFSAFSPNSVGNSKNYSQLTQTTYWHFFHYSLFFQAFHDCLVWCPNCTGTVLSSRTSSEIVSVCPQHCEIVSNSVIPDTIACFSEYNFETLK